MKITETARVAIAPRRWGGRRDQRTVRVSITFHGLPPTFESARFVINAYQDGHRRFTFRR